MVRVGAVGAEGGTYAVHTYPLPLPWAGLGYSTAASPQQLQLALEVPLLTLQRLQLVLALPVRIFKFLVKGKQKRLCEKEVNYVHILDEIKLELIDKRAKRHINKVVKRGQSDKKHRVVAEIEVEIEANTEELRQREMETGRTTMLTY